MNQRDTIAPTASNEALGMDPDVLATEFFTLVQSLNTAGDRRTSAYLHLRLQQIVGDTLPQLPAGMLDKLLKKVPDELGWMWFKSSVQTELQERLLEDFTPGTVVH